MLPYNLEPSLREGEPPSKQECFKAMYEEGASKLFHTGKPELRFATKDELQRSKKRLQEKLPGPKDIWVITKEMSSKDL